MPIYEYECDKCGHEFEREQRMSDAPVKTCPKCKARRVTKLISQSSFVLKGGGWYADGYSDAKDSKDSKDGKESKDGKSEDKSSSSDSSDDSKSKSKDKGKDKGKTKDKSKTKSSKKSAA